MNKWIQYSIEYANQRSYLDDLFRVYPTIPSGIRDINQKVWKSIETAYENKDNLTLIQSLLKLELFPLKDSYVAYLKKDPNALSRNPQTINRLCGRIYELSLTELWKICSQPKETNRQIGPMFKEWVHRGALGLVPVNLQEFTSNNNNAILNASDKVMMDFAKEHLGYTRNKGLDFLARFNGKYILGEAKFLTDFGGHQNAQFNDAMDTVSLQNVNAILIAILDGVLYIPTKNKLYKAITDTYKDYNIMSALVLREFLYQI